MVLMKQIDLRLNGTKNAYFVAFVLLLLLMDSQGLFSLLFPGRPPLFGDVMLELDFPISCNHTPCYVCPCAGDCSYFQYGVDDDEKTDWFPIFDCATTEESSP